jgi:hypothetical protein
MLVISEEQAHLGFRVIDFNPDFLNHLVMLSSNFSMSMISSDNALFDLTMCVSSAKIVISSKLNNGEI